jgi:hypothetical protein
MLSTTVQGSVCSAVTCIAVEVPLYVVWGGWRCDLQTQADTAACAAQFPVEA